MAIQAWERRSGYFDVDYTMNELKDIKYALDQSVIVAITDQKGTITFVNDHFCEISKYAREELVGENHRILNSGFHSQSFFRDMWKTIGSGEVWKGEVCNRAKDNSIYWVQTTIVPFLNEEGKPYQYIAIRADITTQKSIEKIEHMAYHDELTGLPNRRKLDLLLPKAIEAYGQVGVILINIDDFRRINDGFGRATGDEFLIEVKERLSQLCPEEQCLFRLYGDEFLMLVNGIESNDALTLAAQILKAFDDQFLIYGREFYANVSIGISLSPKHSTSVEELIKKANLAMVEAKKMAASTFVKYLVSMDQDYDELLLIENKLRKAIAEDKLELYYQPKIETKTGKMMGMEALIRWFDDELGYIPPNKFIPIAEKRGLIDTIGEWTIRIACKQMESWNKKYGTSLRVAVNISATQFMQPTFFEKVQEIILETGVAPEHFELEITEDSMMDHTEESIQTLAQLQKMGITIAMDDFGTGYSSFSYLRQFPIDAIKIDQSFIRNLSYEDESSAIVKVMIQLGHALGLDVVAEGVEEEDELEILRALDCDIIQGYYYSRPLPVDAFEEKLKTLQG